MIIDAEELEQQVEKMLAEKGKDTLTFKEVEQLIKDQANTGYTSVTRCKRCMEYIVQTGRCRRWGIHVRDDNNYCMYGLFLKGYEQGRY